MIKTVEELTEILEKADTEWFETNFPEEDLDSLWPTSEMMKDNYTFIAKAVFAHLGLTNKGDENAQSLNPSS